MKFREALSAVLFAFCFDAVTSQCRGGQSLTFARWTGVAPDRFAPVFVYSASGDEASLTGACLARCRELQDCAGVAVAYGRGNCQGLAAARATDMKVDSDASYFQKICMDLPEDCAKRWWALESTPGYHLNTDGPHLKVVLNSTVQDCYTSVLVPDGGQKVVRSAQWVGREGAPDGDVIQTSDSAIGNCIVNLEDKFTEPESYRVANYRTFYIENQCRHDYSKKIDRCSYEEYDNQTLKHVEFSATNYTKDECKKLCELEARFVCRGFTWSAGGRGRCDLHSEDLVSTGSWLFRRASAAAYYRRVICLNISVECEARSMVVRFRPRAQFRGRVYVPGRGAACGARAAGGLVALRLPLYGDCDVNFAHAISRGPSGVVNRTMAYVMVMVQHNPIIQTAGDRWVRVGCAPAAAAAAAVDATIAVRDTNKPSFESESEPTAPGAASAVFNSIPDSAAVSMYVVRAGAGPEARGAVALGEPLELRIETADSSEVSGYHLVASSRLGDSSVLLLDGRGCPTGQVDFPPFTRTWLPGSGDGSAGGQRLSARFKAFRFPSSHVVRFALMVRRCDGNCAPLNCDSKTNRTARNTNDTSNDSVPASIREDVPWAPGTYGAPGVVAAGGCGGPGRAPLELELVVGARDILSADTLLRADSQTTQASEERGPDGSLVCVHVVLLVALALGWLAVQVALLLGCCVLVTRYRNLAEMCMQKDYQSFDNVGFDNVSTHRRVHWPDQTVDILHAH